MIMKFTESEQDLMARSRIGEIFPAQGHLVRVVSIDENVGMYGLHALGCEWFARCGQDATSLLPHPILGYVPACDRCHQFATK